jgi:hypothetical protein
LPEFRELEIFISLLQHFKNSKIYFNKKMIGKFKLEKKNFKIVSKTYKILINNRKHKPSNRDFSSSENRK